MNEILKKRIGNRPLKKFLPIDRDDAYDEGFRDGAKFILNHQFISVKEALPEDEEYVIALIAGVPVIAKGIHVKENLKDITHWMSIPKFETKDKEDKQ